MTISVLQWNVWFEEGIERVHDFLRKNGADVICLQELTKGYISQTQDNTWEYLAKELGYYCYAKEMPIITKTSQWSQANAIFSRFPITHTRYAWINEPAKQDLGQYRSYVETDIEVGGSRVTVGTTHMSFVDRIGGISSQKQEAKKLLEIIEAKKGKYILAGDLNAVPGSPVIAEICKRLKHAGPDFDEKTWTTKAHSFDGFSASRLNWRYDYIFTSNDIRVISSDIIDTDISDHLPIRVELLIP